ncbi:peptidoglycan hydrolase-like protein with peptidoglycan-binding domain [Cytobacillus firmus]|uniref:Peptidoglycan hydrolase-like protein with peptidoglycan-binding domain n=2 Tax=Cytobacillus TaxID=2675230 RepID=A0A366JHP1_CYTFI|nr:MULTISPECIES: glycoside hydrolase domain-containing protein [Cytobacillus]RBP86543.1 peptidoglycan hydrolase-like protein with peptidoglycan-binding domain [Cytobacillus firmus]TDX39284.1 peptidoglycan hydrolase-like protein with peptidoglycan-binding domain [Cytobacillus oceanisediminis]
MDLMVLMVQEWVNSTYGGRNGYVPAPENGKTGWSTVYALTRALQIELGIGTPADNFGPGTSSAYKAWGEMELGKVPETTKGKNIVQILQGACYCKGYDPGRFHGIFDENLKNAVIRLQTDAGLPVRNGKVYDYVFKAFLTMDAYVLTIGGDPRIRQMQQELNNKYYTTSGVQPCDGHYQRGTNRALIYGIQTEEGIEPSLQTGSVGPTTRDRLPTLSLGSSGNFVKLLQYALYVNGFDPGAFSGIYDSAVRQAVLSFQSFCMLPADGVTGKQTWLSALVSTGDSTRKGTACDCVTMITPARAEALKAAGYQTVGRYLTNVPNSSLNKKIQPGELQNIFNAGLTVFPIYQTIGSYLDYFSLEQGRIDAQAALNAAREYGFLKGTTIYFAVDFDVLGHEITENIIPYFIGVNERMSNLGGIYKIGVYGPRAVCIRVSAQGLATTSFVSGMSTGYSGNLGYPLPGNWAFDQISTISIGSGTGQIEIDNNIKSGRYNGESKVDPQAQYPDNPDMSNHVFFDLVDKIYDIAFDHTGGDIPEANILVCQYLRGKRYFGSLWNMAAGFLDDEFMAKVDSQLNNPPINEIYDPKFKVDIGVYHLAATLNSVLHHGTINKAIVDFAGWAGDLVDAAGTSAVAEGFDSAYDAALHLIGHLDETKSRFSMTDFIGDVDAVNIGNMLLNIPQPINSLLRHYYEDRYKVRFSLFFESRFSGDPNVVQSQSTYVLTSDEAGMLEIRRLFMFAFETPGYSIEQGEEVARAFKDILVRLSNEE